MYLVSRLDKRVFNILSMVMVFSLKGRTAPILCKFCLPMIRLYKGALTPACYSTIYQGSVKLTCLAPSKSQAMFSLLNALSYSQFSNKPIT
jgi:hypothetical protein